MKQVEVSILGQVYMLGCPEGGESLLRTAVASVDREMNSIREAGKVRARERIAVLAALNLAYQLAERGGAQPVPVSSATGGRTGASGRDNGVVDIEALLQRVDAAIADDGRLL